MKSEMDVDVAQENGSGTVNPQEEKQETTTNPDDAQRDKVSEFDSNIMRRAFIRKVFLVMTGQLLITCIIVAPLILIESTRLALTRDRSIFIGAILIFWVLYSCVICWHGISRTWPYNYVMLTLLTVSLALIIACTCAALNFKDILVGIVSTAGLCFTLGIITNLSTFDFSILTGALSSFLFILLILIFLCYWIPAKTLIWFILCLGMTLLIMYFLIDIQIIIRGKHRYILSPEDYIAAATLLYVDVVYIFSFMAMMLIRKA